MVAGAAGLGPFRDQDGTLCVLQEHILNERATLSHERGVCGVSTCVVCVRVWCVCTCVV